MPFIPTVKAQEEEELVDPQAVLRVCFKKFLRFKVIWGKPSTFIVFFSRRNAELNQKWNLYSPNTLNVMIVSMVVAVQQKHALRSSSTIYMNWIIASPRLCGQNLSKY